MIRRERAGLPLAWVVALMTGLFGCAPTDGAIFEVADTDSDGDSEALETTAPSADVPAGAHCEPVAVWDEASAAAEEEMLELINQQRAAGAYCAPATHTLDLAPELRCAARLHSKDMVERDFYSTINPDGLSPGDRVYAAGYDGSIWGENVTRGYVTAADAMADLMSSESLCINIMDPDYRYIGLGRFGASWTQDYGS